MGADEREPTTIALSTPASDRSSDPITTPRTKSDGTATDTPTAATPDPAATELALKIAEALDEKQARDIAILDVSGPLVIADYFVIATVQSTRQAQSLARELDAASKAMRGRRRRHASGLDGDVSNWLLLDFDEVVVHLFQPEARSYYGLETLWADVPRVPFEPSATPTEKDAADGNEIRQPTLDGFGAFLPDGSAPDGSAPDGHDPGGDDPGSDGPDGAPN